MPKYLPSRKAAELLGLHPNTLRQYANEGRIEVIRTASGQRRYNVDQYICGTTKPTIVCYCRVSSPGQRADLERQIAFLSEKFPGAEIVRDIGSALNYKRKGFTTILGRCLRGEKLQIVVAHRDRLARFGFDLIEWIVRECGSTLMVLNDSVREPEQELTEDLLTIIHDFSYRLYGLGTYKAIKNKAVAKQVATEGAEFVVRNLSLHLQRNDLAAKSTDSST